MGKGRKRPKFSNDGEQGDRREQQRQLLRPCVTYSLVLRESQNLNAVQRRNCHMQEDQDEQLVLFQIHQFQLQRSSDFEELQLKLVHQQQGREMYSLRQLVDSSEPRFWRSQRAGFAHWEDNWVKAHAFVWRVLEDQQIVHLQVIVQRLAASALDCDGSFPIPKT